MINVCIGIGSLAGAAILSTRKPTEKCGHTVAVCLCVIAALMISSALIYWLTVDLGNAINVFLIAFSAGCLVLGVMIAWINVPISTTMMRIVDRDKLSKVNSIMSMGSQGMTPLASVLAGVGVYFLMAMMTELFTAEELDSIPGGGRIKRFLRKV